MRNKVIAILCFAILAAAYTAELSLAGSYLGMGAPSTPMWNSDLVSAQRKKEIALARTRGDVIDSRDQFEVLAELHERGVEAVPAVMLADVLGNSGPRRSAEFSDGDELRPLGGVSRVVTALCNESGRYVTYESDEHGFRNPAGIWTSARADLAAVGQSLTQGYCVADREGFVDLLRTRYPVTMNLGMSGESSLLQLAAIREYLPRYAPKIVLWCYTEGMDLHDLYEESRNASVMRYLDSSYSQRLLTRQPEIDNRWREFVAEKVSHMRQTGAPDPGRALLEKSVGILKLWNLREKIELVYGLRSDAEPWSLSQPAMRSLLSETLVQARTVTGGWGGTMYFVYLPSWTRYRNASRASERERTRVLNLVASLGIPIIDVHSAFQAQRDPLSLFPFRRFGHYNVAGHTIVAETVLSALSAREGTASP